MNNLKFKNGSDFIIQNKHQNLGRYTCSTFHNNTTGFKNYVKSAETSFLGGGKDPSSLFNKRK